MVDMTLGDTQDIIGECKKQGLLRNQAAYVLATALWETAHTMKPVVEAYWLSESWRANNLRYYPWHGRGYVQLTWEDNYKRAQKELGLGTILTSNPDNALDPQYAKQILVKGSKEGWFTGKKLSDYITLQKSDFKGARRIINGTDKDDEIAKIAIDYDKKLLAQGYGVEGPADPVTEVVEDADKPLYKSKTGWAAILTGTLPAIGSVFSDWRVQIFMISIAAVFAAFIVYDRWRKGELGKRAKEWL